MSKQINSLMMRMTPEEKIGQLNLVNPGIFANTGAVVTQDIDGKIRKGQVGGLFGYYDAALVGKTQRLAVEESRLGIPLIFGLDVIHGHKTIFPIPLALSCTWDMPLIEKSARIAAMEATADGLNWVFSPMVDIARDPRWGRIAEGAGEDPYLGSKVAAAMVRGYQGDDLSRPDTVMACVKHLALYGDAEGGRDYNTTDMSRLKMHEYYLPPYKAAVEAGAGSVMSSFNEVDGVPAAGNKWLMKDLLRGLWGFNGFVVTDYTSINEMTCHGTGGLKENSARALKAGTDMDMVGECFLTTLLESLEDGSVSMDDIDAACRRILEAKERLGLFDDPYRYVDEKRAGEVLSEDSRAAARDMAARSCVLLKNDGPLLPLKKEGTIAVIGPLADDKRNMPGTWSIASDWTQCVSVLEGMKNAAGAGVKFLHAAGANFTRDPVLAERLNFSGERVLIDPRSQQEMIDEALKVARKADVVVAVVGEAQEMSGEAASRVDIGIPQEQLPLIDALSKTGKPLVLVIATGRPLTLVRECEQAQAMLLMWFGGTEAGNGVADVLFGHHNPSGRLTATFPRHVGQVPLYYNHKNTGRPYDGAKPAEKFKSRYLDVENGPLFPFGFGLGYAPFEYGPLRLDKTELQGAETLTAAIAVKNAGDCAGEETVQLYVSDPVASVTRSVKDLKGFEKVFLQPGEEKDVSFAVTTEQLMFFNGDLQRVWEPGEFVIHVGRNSGDVQSASVQWKK
ncbi:MAG: beta-glucosidase BglX [Alphaproteobacteria bacterium]|nr:beta-glucosidase BglX [Alphaproteobacteria bacterium]